MIICLLYTSDAADDLLCVDLGGRRIIKKKKKNEDKDEPIEIEAELSEREKEIKEIVGSDKNLRKDLFTYLREVKEKEGLDKEKHLSIDDLSDGQFKQLKNILNTFKKMA